MNSMQGLYILFMFLRSKRKRKEISLQLQRISSSLKSSSSTATRTTSGSPSVSKNRKTSATDFKGKNKYSLSDDPSSSSSGLSESTPFERGNHHKKNASYYNAIEAGFSSDQEIVYFSSDERDHPNIVTEIDKKDKNITISNSNEDCNTGIKSIHERTDGVFEGKNIIGGSSTILEKFIKNKFEEKFVFKYEM